MRKTDIEAVAAAQASRLKVARRVQKRAAVRKKILAGTAFRTSALISFAKCGQNPGLRYVLDTSVAHGRCQADSDKANRLRARAQSIHRLLAMARRTAL